MPTGDRKCPLYIKRAKQFFYKIIAATNGSKGGSEDYNSDINNVDMINGRDDYEDDGEERVSNLIDPNHPCTHIIYQHQHF